MTNIIQPEEFCKLFHSTFISELKKQGLSDADISKGFKTLANDMGYQNTEHKSKK